jgi:hypothetical protein
MSQKRASSPEPDNSEPVPPRAAPDLPKGTVAIICILIFGLGIFYFVPLPFGLGNTGNPNRVMIIGFVIVVVMILLVITAARLIQEHRAKTWPQAKGKILKSKIEEHRHQFTRDDPEEVWDMPGIEYEFDVGKKHYLGSRIGLGDQGRNHVQETLDKYKVGTDVMVFYNPADPSDCALERGVPEGMALGCLYLLAVFGAIGYALYWLWTVAVAALERFRPEANARLAFFSGAIGLFLLGAFISSKPKIPQDFDELKSGPWLFLLIALGILAISLHAARVFG